MASFLPILKSLELACIAEGILVPGELFWRQSHQNNTALPRYSRQLRRLVYSTSLEFTDTNLDHSKKKCYGHDARPSDSIVKCFWGLEVLKVQ